MIRRLLSLSLTFTVPALALIGCGNDDDEGGGDASGSTTVIASFYPLAFAAERVGGDRVTVTNLTPPGVEAHDLELSPDQLDSIEDADVAIALGGDFQPALDEAVAKRTKGKLVVLDAIDTEGSDDPHVWLDPVLMKDVVNKVAETLSAADDANKDDYTANAATLTTELDALDAKMKTGLASCERKVFITAHDAFGRLAARYGLTAEGAAGLSPDAEPNADRLAELADLIKQTGSTTVFSEELMPPDLTETLARETGAKIEVLSTLEGLAEEQVAAGADYLSVLEENLTKLRAALGCT